MSDVFSAGSGSSCFWFLSFVLLHFPYAVCVCLTKWSKVAARWMCFADLRLLCSVTSSWGVKVFYSLCVCNNKATQTAPRAHLAQEPI